MSLQSKEAGVIKLAEREISQNILSPASSSSSSLSFRLTWPLAAAVGLAALICTHEEGELHINHNSSCVKYVHTYATAAASGGRTHTY